MRPTVGAMRQSGADGADPWQNFVKVARDSVRNNWLQPQQNPMGPRALKMPNYAEGTDYVPETGPAMLHEGEAVLPKEAADIARSGRVSEALGGQKKPKTPKPKTAKPKAGKKKSGGKGKKKGSKKPHVIHIRRAANGGFIVEHEYKKGDGDGDEPPDNEEHQVNNIDELQQHIADNMGDQEPAAAPAGAPAGPVEQPPLRGGM